MDGYLGISIRLPLSLITGESHKLLQRKQDLISLLAVT